MTAATNPTMSWVVHSGGSRVGHVTVPVPAPKQVLVAMTAASICGSDFRTIYREHLGHGPEAY